MTLFAVIYPLHFRFLSANSQSKAEKTKFNRAEPSCFDAIKFRLDAISFRFDAIKFRLDAIKFAAKALRFPFVGPRLQRDHRRNLREGFAFDFGAMSRRKATRRFTQMKQISQIFLCVLRRAQH